MKQFGGWYFPDHEEHLLGWMRKVNREVDGRQSYQYTKLEQSLKWCNNRRVALDVGCHIGLWSYYLASEFGDVRGFEPVAAHRECFAKNVQAKNVSLYAMALGDKDDDVSMHTSKGSSGDSWISGPGVIPMSRLDDLCIDFVDFIKVDCEGSELFVLHGAEETIKRCTPCIVVEQKPGHAQRFGLGERDAVTYLQELGAVLRAEMSGDFILSFP